MRRVYRNLRRLRRCLTGDPARVARLAMSVDFVAEATSAVDLWVGPVAAVTVVRGVVVLRGVISIDWIDALLFRAAAARALN